jgi:hypothetical protein
MKINVFNRKDVDAILARIDELTPEIHPKWGKMNVAKMLSHCNVTYELVYENIHPKPNPFKVFILKLVIKPSIVSDKPYKNSLPTAPEFIIHDDKDFEVEKKRLVAYIEKTFELGEDFFDGKKSHSFGKLSMNEWNSMFAKHLDHHLKQFGV